MKATPFASVLVANRGEIALRVMRSARRLGLATIAVHSSADAGAPHVRAADRAVAIGGALPAESYLSIDAVIAAAQASGADAVHPGYGFLAENADFARACRDAGLVFVGPSAEAIAAMGDKADAKRLMRAAGVPCIPGYDGADRSDAVLATEAGRIGYPVMIKATAGGGGRGMRRVENAASFAAALRSARSEARSAFGSDDVILERALSAVRHVEVQVFADRFGNVVHLGERDCSVQRRHQKLIEEAPSPGVDAALRERLGAAALTAVRAMAYEGAGTIEFLLEASGAFHFMEMNTRLQVEHPVTEAITGLDLVEWQLRVAAGEALPLRQDAVRFEGHAIEVRLCAEDPARDFMPQSGTVALWRPPRGVRAEHALHDGAWIAPWYDSMIAKVVAHGVDREAARRRLVVAIENLVVLGVPTNRAHLLGCLEAPVFVAGAATTAFLNGDGEGAALAARTGAVDPRLVALAALLLFQTGGAFPAAGPCANGGALYSRPLAHRLPLPMRLAVAGTTQAATVARVAADAVSVAIDGATRRYDVIQQHEDSLVFSCEGLEDRVRFVRASDRLWLQHRGRDLVVDDRSYAAPPKAEAAGGDGRVRAALNGRVVAVLVRPGDRVESGQPLITVEAMKIEHVHSAPRAGAVAEVRVAAGAQVAAGEIVAVIDAPPGFEAGA